MKGWGVFRAVYWRTLLKVVRRPVILLLSFVQPLIWLCFFGFLFQRFDLGALPFKLTYLDFLVPGICGMTVLVGASQSGLSMIRDMQSGVLERMLRTPAEHFAWLAGKISADTSRLLAQAVCISLLGLCLGARYQINIVGLSIAVLCLVLFAFGYCALSCLVALKAQRQESMAAFIHLTNMPVFFTSSALVPTKRMPPWLETIAAWNPLSLVLDQLRPSLLFGVAAPAFFAIGFLSLSCLILVAMTLRQLKLQLVKNQ